MYRQLRIDDSMRDYLYLCSKVHTRDYIIGEPKLEVHNQPTVETMHLQFYIYVGVYSLVAT